MDSHEESKALAYCRIGSPLLGTELNILLLKKKKKKGKTEDEFHLRFNSLQIINVIKGDSGLEM